MELVYIIQKNQPNQNKQKPTEKSNHYNRVHSRLCRYYSTPLIRCHFDVFYHYRIQRTNLELTFIDLIKGVIPQSLFELIFQYTESQTTTYQILHLLMNEIHYSALKQIWKPDAIYQKKHFNISVQDKKQKCTASKMDVYH